MKHIFPKFKINKITYLIFLSFLLTGYIKHIIIIFTIIIFHEMGHIMLLKLFKIEIISVEIYPFGGITSSNKLINTSVNRDIIIYLGGIINQVFLCLFFTFLYKKNIITYTTLEIFNMYNKSILIFNILPIKPLDGGEIVRLILEKFISFKKAYYISNIISIISLMIFIIYNITYNLNEYVIISFLFFKLLITIREEAKIFNKFLLERFLYNISYKKIQYNRKVNLKKLKKETYHYFKTNNKVISETTVLNNRFDINKNI